MRRIKETHEKKDADPDDVLSELKKKRAKQVVLTLIQPGETLGVDEVVQNLPSRQFSMQVASEACVYLFLPAK